MDEKVKAFQGLPWRFHLTCFRGKGVQNLGARGFRHAKQPSFKAFTPFPTSISSQMNSPCGQGCDSTFSHRSQNSEGRRSCTQIAHATTPAKKTQPLSCGWRGSWFMILRDDRSSIGHQPCDAVCRDGCASPRSASGCRASDGIQGKQGHSFTTAQEKAGDCDTRCECVIA